MSTVAALSCVPDLIEAGTTVRFKVSNSAYPATLWTLAFILNNGLDAPLVTAGTASGTGFDVVLTAANTATLKTGAYTWAEIFTAISPTTEKGMGRVGALDVLPNLAVTATPSVAQAQVTLLESVIGQLSGGFTSVSFNGQSFSIGSVGEYQRQLVYWKSRLIAERRKLDALRGNAVGGCIPVQFIDGPSEIINTGGNCGC